MSCGGPGGKELPPTSPFAADDGAPHPGVTAVLAAYGAGDAHVADVVAALVGTRVLVPVLAHAVETGAGAGGHTVDREATTAVVAIRVPDGRTAMPVFSGVGAMAAWRRDARPVPAQVERAAASALEEGWPVLVLDPGGPLTVVVPRPAVQALAAGIAWEPAVRRGVVRPDVALAVDRAVAGVPAIVRAQAEAGRRAELAVVLHVRAGLDRAALGTVLDEVNVRLAAEPVVAQVDSIELRPVSA